VRLREEYDPDLLRLELQEMGLGGPILRISNPWYFRKKGTETWIKIGESEDKENQFSVRWETTGLENGYYEILGLMHVFVKKDGGEVAIARQNIAEVRVKN
jgi:hypothetical protein